MDHSDNDDPPARRKQTLRNVDYSDNDSMPRNRTDKTANRRTRMDHSFHDDLMEPRKQTNLRPTVDFSSEWKGRPENPHPRPKLNQESEESVETYLPSLQFASDGNLLKKQSNPDFEGTPLETMGRCFRSPK
jgi:hypothetical protein